MLIGEMYVLITLSLFKTLTDLEDTGDSPKVCVSRSVHRLVVLLPVEEFPVFGAGSVS